MQLDLFEHSADVMLRNAAIEALLARDLVGAIAARAALGAELPADPSLPAIDTLIGALSRAAADADAPLPDHDAVARAREAVGGPTAAAAIQLLGDSSAREWLRPLWAALARRAAALPFAAGRQEHAAPLWLLAGDANSAEAATSTIPSWRRIPLPLVWMLEARYRLHGLDAVWPLLVELFWLAPRRASALVPSLDDPALSRLWRSFQQGFDDAAEDDGSAWFPAWLLCVKPALAEWLSRAEAGQQRQPEQTMRLLVHILGYERQGRQRELFDARRRLRDLHPGLFTQYMSTR